MSSPTLSKSYTITHLALVTLSAFMLGCFAPKAINTLQTLVQPQVSVNSATADSSTKPSTTPVPPPPPSASELAKANALFKSTDWSAQQPQGIKELLTAMPHSAELRTAVLQRYREEPAGKVKDNLKQFLMVQALPDVITTATAWTKKSDNAAARRDGYQLLTPAGGHPDVHPLIKQAILSETDPAALGSAIWALSTPNVADPAEVQVLVPRLHTLTQHTNDDIRAASIQKLADWDRAKQYLLQDVQRLLSDPVEDVRIAAIGATSIASLTSDSIKQQLFTLLSDIKQSEELRGIVHMQLPRFGLSTAEYAAYQAAQKELFSENKVK